VTSLIKSERTSIYFAYLKRLKSDKNAVFYVFYTLHPFHTMTPTDNTQIHNAKSYKK